MKEKTIYVPEFNVNLVPQVFNYSNNSRLAILLYDADTGELWSDLTKNLSEAIMNPSQAYLDADLSNETLKAIRNSGIIRTSFGKGLIGYELVEFDMDKLKEFDSIGIKEFEKNIDYDKIFSFDNIRI